MLHAVLHRKLTPDEDRMEDLLTSTVLGTASYLPAAACWRPLVATIRTADDHPFTVMLDDQEVEVDFWPRWAHEDRGATEPDLVLRWEDTMLAVEVKYLSGKSSAADEERDDVTDQLARQLALCRRESMREGRSQWGVVYLTADVTRPREALRASVDEVGSKLGLDVSAHLGWTSWQSVRLAFASWAPVDAGMWRLRGDLIRYLDRLGFGVFSGVTARPLPFPRWAFAVADRRAASRPRPETSNPQSAVAAFSWDPVSIAPSWTFDRGAT